MSCMSEVQAPLLTEPILLFVNPASGGGLGLELMNRLRDCSMVHVVQLPAEQDTWFEKYEHVVNNPNVRCCAAGGDGTVNWVVQLLRKFYTGVFQPPLAVIPFGTGNDMSRSLGWGSGMTRATLSSVGRTIENIAASRHVVDSDMWEVTIERKDTGDVNVYPMINYVSFGVDAAVTKDYETIRRTCQPLVCCPCMSKTLFVPAGVFHIFGKRPLNDYVTIELEGVNAWSSEPHVMKPAAGDKTLVFMSTPTIYGGRALWRGEQPCSMSDGKLEVVLEGGLGELILSNVGINISRSYAQADGARVETTEPIAYQIDGEASIMNGPAIFTIKRVGSYPLLFAE